MRRRFLERLPILACAGVIAFLFAANLWNAAVERDWPKLRIRGAHPLEGASPHRPAPVTLDAFLSGETQRAVSLNLGRASPVFPISVRAKNQLLYSLFGLSGATAVVVGKRGRLYETTYVDEFCARDGAPDMTRIDAFAKDLAAIQEKLRAGGKGFVYLVSPSKAARYPEDLPALTPCPALTRGTTEKLAPYLAALAARQVAFVDGAGLTTAQRPHYPIDLFPRGGTHWNMLGAALAARALSETLARQSGEAPPFGGFDFDWREEAEAVGPDRDLLDLLNLLWPNAHYPTAVVEGHGGAPACRPARLTLLGGSFLREIIAALARAPCPPQVDYWFYFKGPDGRAGSVRRHIGAGDPSDAAAPAGSAEALRQSVAHSDIVVLEENESNIATMKQVGDLGAAAEGLAH